MNIGCAEKGPDRLLARESKHGSRWVTAQQEPYAISSVLEDDIVQGSLGDVVHAGLIAPVVDATILG